MLVGLGNKGMIMHYLIICFSFFGIFTSSLNAWEVNTHRAIDRCALSDECGSQRSMNLHQFVSATGIDGDNYETELFKGYSTEDGAAVE